MVMTSSSYDDSALFIWGWEYDHFCVLVIRMDDDYEYDDDGDEYDDDDHEYDDDDA